MEKILIVEDDADMSVFEETGVDEGFSDPILNSDLY
mgnify:CR=1 FL=1